MAENPFGGSVSDPFAASREPDPFTQPTRARRKKATKAAVQAASPAGTAQYGGDAGAGNDPMPTGEGDIYGHKYKFSEVTDPENKVQDYVTQGRKGAITLTGDAEKEFGALQADVGPLGTVTAKDGVDYLHDPTKLSDKEYDALTHAASKGNKLAQEILIRGHYKAQDFPSLTQDLNKVEDPFVHALSNLPGVAQTAENQIVAATAPYDFSNAESQVNNILANQGYAQLAQPSAATSAYVGKLDQIASSNPLTSSALGLPSISQALGGLGPAGKLSEKAAPNAALLGALLSHLQYQDVYGTGLSNTQGQQNPAWLQQLLAAVTGTALGGGLPSAQIAAAQLPSTTPSQSATPNA